MAEMVRLKVDGIDVDVEKGSPVIEATRKAGVMVPHYCYHPGLSIAGNCRMCLVEIEKMPKLVSSCTTPAADGMVVRTRSDKVKQAVAGVEEFLLANHPLDCPICDQAGECLLQDYSFRYGKPASRFREDRKRFKKGVDVGPHVVLDSERCIVCTRCVRFVEEITKTGELGVFERGLRSEIGVFPGRELDNPYSGNVVDICPVGALTLKEFRFRKRVWFIRDVPSVCGGCAQGCNVHVGTSENRIWRLTPRENQAVNGWWMCDEGRLSFQPLYETPRLQGCEAAKPSGFEAVRLPEAVDRIAERIKAGPGTAAVVASANLTVEDFWLLKRLASEVAPGLRVVVAERSRGENDGFLIRADRRANRKGAELLGLDVDPGGASVRDLMASVAASRVTTLIALGEDVVTLPGAEAALSALSHGGALIVIDPFLNGGSASATLRVPAAAYGEFEGTWVGWKGRAQRVRRAVTPRAPALPYWQVLALVIRRLGGEAAAESPAEILREVASQVSAFEGVSWTALGAEGMQLSGQGSEEPAPKGLPRPAWSVHV